MKERQSIRQLQGASKNLSCYQSRTDSRPSRLLVTKVEQHIVQDIVQLCQRRISKSLTFGPRCPTSCPFGIVSYKRQAQAGRSLTLRREVTPKHRRMNSRS